MTTAEAIRNRIIKTELVDIDQLTPFQGKLKTLDDKNFNKLRKSIIEEGFSFTVHVWENGGVTYIIDGHQRVSVLSQMRKQGIEIPPISCSFVSAHTYRDAKKLVLLAISQYGKIQKDGFLDFVDGEDFEFGDYDFPDLSFDLDELFEVKAESDFDESKEDDIPDDAPSRVQPGDIWQLGDHRLMCGDSTSARDVTSLMDGSKADMVFTDPPYGVSYSGGHNEKKRKGIKNDQLAGENLTDLFADALKNAVEFTHDHAAFYIWYANGKAVETFASFAKLPLKVRAVICWYKVKSGLGAFMSQYIPNYEPCIYAFKDGESPQWFGPTDEKTVWELPKERVNEFHPTQKPVALTERALANSSKSGDIILDLFLGSGATLIGCEKSGRICHGMELDPKYADVIIERWEQLTGKRAERISSGRA